MVEQTINLGSNPFTVGTEYRWTGSVLLDATLIEGGLVAYLREFGLSSGGVNVILRIADSPTANPEDEGPEFINNVKINSNAIRLTDGNGQVMYITGPNHPINAFQDDSDPYLWDMPAGFFANLFDWMGNTGNGDVSMVINSDDLVLSDFDTTNFESVEALAGLLVGQEEDADIFHQNVDRDGMDVVLEGELGLGSGNTVISRIVRDGNGSNILINDNDDPEVLSLSDYFGADGPGERLHFFIQTISGLIDIPIRANLGNTGGGFANIGIPDLSRAAVNAIGLNQKILIGFALPAVFRDAVVEFRSGSPLIAISAEAVPLVNHDIEVEFRSGSPTVTIVAQAAAIVDRDASVIFRSGSPLFTVSANVFPALFRDAVVEFRSGSPVVSVSARRDLTDVGTLFSGQYVTQMELAIEKTESLRMPVIIPPSLTDIKNLDESLLPFIAYGLGVEGNINFLPANVRCAIMEHAEFYHFNLGTQAALDQAAEDLEITISSTYEDRMGGGRQIMLDVSPPTYAIGDSNWTRFVREFLECLLPWNVYLAAINVNIFFRGNIYLRGAFRAYNLLFVDGGRADNTGVLM